MNNSIAHKTYLIRFKLLKLISMRNSSKTFPFFAALLILLKEGVKKGLEENHFKPWAYNQKVVKPIKDSLTSEFMNSRSPRLVENFNRDWTFNYSPSGQENDSLATPAFDDSSWQAIALPHSWQTYETTGAIHPYIKNASERDDPYWWKGWGYYRKRFEVNEDVKNLKIYNSETLKKSKIKKIKL